MMASTSLVFASTGGVGATERSSLVRKDWRYSIFLKTDCQKTSQRMIARALRVRNERLHFAARFKFGPEPHVAFRGEDSRHNRAAS